MRVLVYPHAMELGGSQLNAVDLAAAVRDRGHQVTVYSEPGPLVERVLLHGLEHVERRPSRLRPGVTTARDLHAVIRERDIDVVHAWEWPPILEGYAAATPRSSAVVGSIMSMGVAGFLPRNVTLTVGTQALVDRVAPGRAGRTALLEPPVDVQDNRPGLGGADFRRAFPAPEGTQQVVVVSRLAEELKLEGLLTAVEAVRRLAADRPLRLVVVGDGPARDVVARAAQQANRRAGREVVVLTGELSDPRGAYDAADICLGMGGSALRALAFGKPLIVQGEGGFFEICTPDTVDRFLHHGWFGIGDRGREEAVEMLVKELDRLLADPAWCRSLGDRGRSLVTERFSLRVAAQRAEALYRHASQTRPSRTSWSAAGLGAAPRLAAYKVERRWQKVRGTSRRDDFNAVSR